MIIATIIIAVAVSCFALVVVIGAPYVPSRKTDIRKLVNSFEHRKGKSFVDLGMGDGKVLLAAAEAGFEVCGYEINPFLWIVAKYRLRKYKTKLYLRSYWHADLGKTDVIYIFSAGPYIKKLEKKLINELKSGSAFFSYGYELPHKRYIKKIAGGYLYHF